MAIKFKSLRPLFIAEDSLKFQFETIGRFDEEDKRVAQAVLEGLILKFQAKQSLQRQGSK